jgi:uncharacterized membrane protein
VIGVKREWAKGEAAHDLHGDHRRSTRALYGGPVKTTRLEAYSDAVLAIIITIMVLELHVPTGHDLSSLLNTAGNSLLTYLLSFVYVGIYWNNHHHMFQLVKGVSGGVLWANLGLLFFLSLFPFATAWMDETHFAHTPVVTYGALLLLAAIAYYLLQTVVIRQQGPESPLRKAVGSDFKGKISPVFYIAGMLSASLIDPHGNRGVAIALACYVAVAALWVVPDRRIDRVVRATGDLD